MSRNKRILYKKTQKIHILKQKCQVSESDATFCSLNTWLGHLVHELLHRSSMAWMQSQVVQLRCNGNSGCFDSGLQIIYTVLHFFLLLNFLWICLDTALWEQPGSLAMTFCGLQKIHFFPLTEWSRNATANNKNLSRVLATTSVNQQSNRSSSIGSSNLANSSSTYCHTFLLPVCATACRLNIYIFSMFASPLGSVFVDSGISERSNSDVVRDESRRRSQFLQGEPWWMEISASLSGWKLNCGFTESSELHNEVLRGLMMENNLSKQKTEISEVRLVCDWKITVFHC